MVKLENICILALEMHSIYSPLNLVGTTKLQSDSKSPSAILDRNQITESKLIEELLLEKVSSLSETNEVPTPIAEG